MSTRAKQVAGIAAAGLVLAGAMMFAPPKRSSPYFEWTRGKAAPQPRVESPVVAIGDTLCLFGGFADRKLHTSDMILCYDVAADRWSSRGRMPMPATHLNGAVVGREIWFAAGFVGDHPGAAPAQVWRYDFDRGTWREGPPLPEPRGGGALVALGSELHYFGGFAADRDMSCPDHWVLSLDGGATGWRAAAPLPAPRGQVGGVALGGVIYAIGGQFRHDSAPVDVDLVHVYDPKTDSWTQRASLPRPRSHSEPGTFVHRGRIVVVGGRDNTVGRVGLDEVVAYDPGNDSWTRLPSLPRLLLAPGARIVGRRIIVLGGSLATWNEPQTTVWLAGLDRPWEQAPELPTALGEVAAGAVGRKLFVVGQGSSATLAFDLPTARWDTTARAPRPFVGHHHAAEVWNDKVYLFGGLGGAEGKTQIYDPAADRWTLGSDMPFPAGSSASARIGDHIYVAGGIVPGDSTTARAARYDPRTDTWSPIAPMPLARNHAAAGTDGKRMFVFGGRGPGSGGGNVVADGFGDTQIYDPETDRWASAGSGVALAPLPQARGGMGKAVYLDGRFYVFGGETKTDTAHTQNRVYSRVDVYDPAGNSWAAADVMPVARHGVFPLVVSGRIYLAGGGVTAGHSESTAFDVFTPGQLALVEPRPPLASGSSSSLRPATR
jgi:N-acetylneuraminic acid mutarotase